MLSPRTCLWLLVIATLLSAFGCGRGPDPTGGDDLSTVSVAKKKERKLHFLFATNAVADFWTIAKKGVDDAVREFDVEVEFRMPPTGAITEQTRIIEDAFNKGIDGLTVSPIDAENQADFLKKIGDVVPLLCHDSDAPQSGRLAFVGTNNYQAGREAGKLIKEALPEGGKIMLFVGRLDAQNAQDRKRGIEEEVAGSGVEIIDTRTDGTDTQKARANAEDALVAHPDLKCLVGLWSYNGPAIASAVRDSGAEGVEIVCFDEDEQTLQAIKDGLIHGTVVQQPYQMGYQTIRILTEVCRGNRDVIPADGIVDTGVQIVKQDNVDAFWADLKKLVGRE